MLRALFSLLLLLVSMNTYASRVQTSATILTLYTYSEQAGYDGDVAIRVSNPPASCPGGFWLRSATTPGYKNTVAILVSAFHSGATLILGGLDDQIWTGSVDKFCRLDQVMLAK